MAVQSPLAGSYAASLSSDGAIDPLIRYGDDTDEYSYVGDSELDAGASDAPDAGFDTESGSDAGSDTDMEHGEPANEGRILWTNLEHRGVYFPPEYKPYRPLPRAVRLLYAGSPVDLPPEAEEIAYAYARVMHRDVAQEPHFIANFFEDLNAALVRCGRPQLADVSRCDFRLMREHFLKHDAQLRKRGRPKKSPQPHERYRWCWVDGEQCEVLYYKLDPPGLYVGRQQTAVHNGRFVRRVRPEEITLNLSPGFEQAVKPPYGKWKRVISDRTQLWLAEYRHPVAGLLRVRLAGHRRWSGSQPQHRVARELGDYLWRLRADYRKDMRSTLTVKREAALVLWFVDLLGLRFTNTRLHAQYDYDLGLESLQCAGVVLGAPSSVEIRLVGPSNLTYTKSVMAPPLVCANLQHILANKRPEDTVFSPAAVRAAISRLQQYRRVVAPVHFRAFSFSRALQLAIDEYEPAVIYKYIPRRATDRVAVFQQLYRKVAAVMNMIPQVPADRDAENPRIELYKWALFRLKMKLQVLNPAFVVGETMDVAQYRRLGLRYANEVDPRFRQNYELEIMQETATGVVQLASNATIPNDPAYVWDLVYDKMLLIDLERLRMINPELVVDSQRDTIMDPRIAVAYAKRHDVPIRRIMRISPRTRWAHSTEARFRY